LQESAALYSKKVIPSVSSVLIPKFIANVSDGSIASISSVIFMKIHSKNQLCHIGTTVLRLRDMESKMFSRTDHIFFAADMDLTLETVANFFSMLLKRSTM
jgi:hypothetical protein